MLGLAHLSHLPERLEIRRLPRMSGGLKDANEVADGGESGLNAASEVDALGFSAEVAEALGARGEQGGVQLTPTGQKADVLGLVGLVDR